jgi:cellobiose phosphorylase
LHRSLKSAVAPGWAFRDTSQDVMSVVHTNPRKCRQRIVELLKAQVSQGYGLHLFDPDWFDPEKQKAPAFKSPTIAHAPNVKSMIHGIEHACSDDALWIVVTTCEYVKETGDVALFDQVLPFADAGEATVYEHLKRSLDFSAEQVGQTGICKGLRADWNDCLNLGGGESAMVSFMHYWALRAFVEAAEYLGRRRTPRSIARWQRKSAPPAKENCGTASGICAALPPRAGRSARGNARRARSFWRAIPGRWFPAPLLPSAPILRWMPWISICFPRMAFIWHGRPSQAQ